ncbi:MAG: ATP synthase subunit a [Nitrospiraceae bacterium]|jgi:F-type H+-transporting ATPase subunit a|nr:MAG: ATP synthase subunit a [Nitrospiraceae bacterium]
MESEMASGEVVFHVGPLGITEPILTTWGIMLLLTVLSWLASRRLAPHPAPWQAALEGLFGAAEDAIRSVLPGHADRVFPFIASLWIFIVVANLIGLIPGLHAPTADLSVTSALAILVFVSVHWFGVQAEGWKTYLRHYLTPMPAMLPFHLMGEITRTVTLAVRLFGNMMSLEMAALLVLLVAGFLAPVPLLVLHIVEALIQAYIFGMLALIYIAGAIQTQQLRQHPDEG